MVEVKEGKRPSAGVALFWNGVGKVFRELVRFTLGVLLARLIRPSEFGIIGLVIVVVAICDRIQEGGIKAAIVKERHLSESDLTTALIVNLTLSGIVFTSLFWSADWLAIFFREPLLVQVVPFLAIGLLIDSTVIVHNAILTREMRFEEQARAGFWSALISGLSGLIYAFIQPTVWALVFSSLIGKLSYATFLWSYRAYVPKSRPSMGSFIKLTRYGGKIALSSLIESVSNNALPLIIGKQFGSVQLGLWNRASSMKEIPLNNIYLITQPVIFAKLCEQSHDRRLQRLTYRKINHLMAYTVSSLMMFFFFHAETIVQVVLGETWLESARLLSLLSLFGIFHQMTRLNNDIVMSTGNANLVLKHEVFRKGLFFFAILLSWPLGINGMLQAIVVQSAVSYIIMLLAVQNALEISTMNQIAVFGGYIGVAFVAGFLSTQSHWGDSPLQLFFSLIVSGISYGVVTIWLSRFLRLRGQLEMYRFLCALIMKAPPRIHKTRLILKRVMVSSKR